MSNFKKIIIKSIDKNFKYPIYIGNDILSKIKSNFQKNIKNKKVFIIYDNFFNPLNFPNSPITRLENIINEVASSSKMFPLDGGDLNKNFKVLQNLVEKILLQKIDRESIIITFGGGVIGDIGGFASAVLLRGIDFVQVPTTLLAQVDSSVGGKTGINTKQGKNLIGAFHQPTKVIIDTKLIESLPKREFFAGIAEVIKNSLICDKNFFKYLLINYKNILALKKPHIENIIYKSCFIKSKIVSEDEKEKGIRATLNLGHTFGHALESMVDYNSSHLIHGEAVSIGMCMAYRLSEKLNLCDKKDVIKVENLVKKFKLPISVRKHLKIKLNYKKMFEKLYSDKKVKNGKLTFVLPIRIGKVIIKNNINPKKILFFLKEEINE